MRLPLTCALAAALLALTACDDAFHYNTSHGGAVTEDGYCGVVQVFEAQCYTCHSAAAPTNDLDLETDAWAAIVDQPSSYGAVLVTPGDRDASVLYTKCAGTQLDSEGGNMPPGPGMDAASLDLLGAWIDDGAPEEDCAR